MPQFHQMMGDRLRSVEQGADTVVWLALSKAAGTTRSGQFFQGELWQFPPPTLSLYCGQSDTLCIADRQPVSTHLPLAWTHSSKEDIEGFMDQLDALAKVIQSQPGALPELNGPSGPSRTNDWINFLIYFNFLLCEAYN